MATTSSNFFTNGTPEQFERVMNLYTQVLRLKAESKNKKPEELVKLDNWYQHELPKKIKARGKDAHLNHEELVQLMKWKQTRGKFYPQLNYLVKVNTPRAVMMETKKAFKKLPNLELALSALGNLKGVGTTLASALLAAATPEVAPFMADECLMAIPDIEGIDYTTKEYLKFVNFINNTVERLNKESKNGESWNAHQVELALWTHYVASELKPELLEDIVSVNSSSTNGNSTHVNGSNQAIDACSDESNLEPATQKDKSETTTAAVTSSLPSEPEDTSSLQSLASEKSLDGSIGNHIDDMTNDSVMTSADDTNDSSSVPAHSATAAVPSHAEVEAADDNASSEPPLKKTKLSQPDDEQDSKVESSDEKMDVAPPPADVEEIESVKEEVSPSVASSDVTPEKPEEPSEKPETSSEKTEDCSEKPDASSEKPEASSEKPEVTTEKAEVTTEKVEVSNGEKSSDAPLSDAPSESDAVVSKEEAVSVGESTDTKPVDSTTE